MGFDKAKTYSEWVSNREVDFKIRGRKKDSLSDQDKLLLHLSPEEREQYKTHIKYMYIGQVRYSKRKYYNRAGMIRYKRFYGISFMTDDNMFQYDMFVMKSLNLTSHHMISLKKRYITKYKIDKNTKICIDKSISRYDMIRIFFEIIRSVTYCTVSTVNAEKMYKAINFYYKYFKWTRYGKQRREALFDKLVNMEKLPYVGRDVKLSLQLDINDKRDMRMCAIIAPLYMFIKEKNHAKLARYAKAKEEKLKLQEQMSEDKQVEE